MPVQAVCPARRVGCPRRRLPAVKSIVAWLAVNALVVAINEDAKDGRRVSKLIEAVTDRPWKRVALVIAALFLLWVALPWLLDAPPMDITPAGAPFPAE